MTHSDQKEDKKISSDIEYERQKTKVVQENCKVWQDTVTELEARLGNVEEEDSEWKTRFENQASINKQLETRVSDLRQKMKEVRAQMRSLSGSLGEGVEDASPAGIQRTLAKLTREKYNLEGQLRDCGWRMDQEAKLFHKADEKRKALLMDIAQTRLNIIKQQEQSSNQQLERALRALDREFKNKNAGGFGRNSATRNGSHYGQRNKKMSAKNKHGQEKAKRHDGKSTGTETTSDSNKFPDIYSKKT